MKTQVIIGALVLCVAAIVGAHEYQKWSKKNTEREDMKSTYSAVINAYNASDADAALRLLSERTFDLYAGIARQALGANEAQTRALPPHQLLEVLGLRTKATRKQVSGLDGRGVVALMVKNGMWASGDPPMRIAEAKVMSTWGEVVLVDGEWADAYKDQRTGALLGSSRRTRSLRSREPKIPKPPRMVIRMVKEQGDWKVCDAGSGPGIDAYWGELARIEGLNEVELVAIAMDAIDENGKMDAKLWRPMR